MNSGHMRSEYCRAKFKLFRNEQNKNKQNGCVFDDVRVCLNIYLGAYVAGKEQSTDDDHDRAGEEHDESNRNGLDGYWRLFLLELFCSQFHKLVYYYRPNINR